MGTRVGVAEFLEKVSKLGTEQEMIDALKFNDSVILRMVLQGAYDPAVKWLLPPGKPPYKVNELVDQENVFIREHRKLTYFVEGFYPNLPQTKREQMFIELLENIAPADAEMLCAIKDKEFPWPRITEEVVRTAFPDMIATPMEPKLVLPTPKKKLSDKVKEITG
jgi:Family of unknown function (DUF6433)